MSWGLVAARVAFGLPHVSTTELSFSTWVERRTVMAINLS